MMRAVLRASTLWRSFGSNCNIRPGSATHRLAVFARDRDLTADHDHPGALVYLVLAQAAARRYLKHDCPAVVPALQDLRSVRTQRHRLQIPALHTLPASSRSRCGGDGRRSSSRGVTHLRDDPAVTASGLRLRSALYVPGANERALEKARDLAADALILDLEDSVAPGVQDSGSRPSLRARAQRRLRQAPCDGPDQRDRDQLARGRPGCGGFGRARCGRRAQGAIESGCARGGARAAESWVLTDADLGDARDAAGGAARA